MSRQCKLAQECRCSSLTASPDVQSACACEPAMIEELCKVCEWFVQRFEGEREEDCRAMPATRP